MKKAIKTMIVIILLVFAASLSAPGLADGTGWEWGIILTGCDADGGYLTVPSEIDGKQVIGIGGNCFNSNGDITAAVFPESVKIIGDYAFALSGLEEIAFEGDEYLYIGNGAFMGTNIRHVEMPRFAGTIGEGLFDECTQLESVVLSDYMLEIPGYMFRECCENLTSIRLPESCRSIGELAFYYCAALSEITWPSELRRIEESAFESCYALERIELPEQLEYIGENAFCDCRSLICCRIPETVRFIADTAFDGCDSIVLAVDAGSYAEEYAVRLSIPYVISE